MLVSGLSALSAFGFVFSYLSIAGADDVTGFALPAAALGLRLGGAVPFNELVSVRGE